MNDVGVRFYFGSLIDILISDAFVACFLFALLFQLIEKSSMSAK